MQAAVHVGPIQLWWAVGEGDALCDSQESVPGYLESRYLWVCSYGGMSLSRVPVGSCFASEASLGGGESGILVTAVLPFKMTCFLWQCQPPRSVYSGSQVS